MTRTEPTVSKTDDAESKLSLEAASQSSEPQYTEQDLLRSLGLYDDTEGDDKADDTNVASEGSEAPQNESLEEPEDDVQEEGQSGKETQDAETETGADETDGQEEVPLEDRLADVEKIYQPEPEGPETELKQIEVTLSAKAQELQQDFLAGLPQGGYFEKNGKPIYQMDGQEINDYLIELKDNGQEFAAGQVQVAYNKAIDAAAGYQKKVLEYRALEQDYHTKKSFTDWVAVKNEIATKLPEITQEDFAKVGEYIDHKLQTDPQFVAAVATKEGKLKRGVEALEQLGILKRLRDQMETTEPKNQKPSAPDARAVSKKVKSSSTGKPTYKRSEVAHMPQDKFNKLSEREVDQLLQGGFIDDL